MRIDLPESAYVDDAVQPTGVDDLGINWSDVLAYGFTPKSVHAARQVLRSVEHAPDVSFLAFDVGSVFASHRCHGANALLSELRAVVVSSSVITVAVPHGSARGLALEFCLSCNMMTIDADASLVARPGEDGYPDLTWALGDMATIGSEPDGVVSVRDALDLRIVDVVTPPSQRREAVRGIALGLGRKRLSSHAFYKSLAIAKAGRDASNACLASAP